jgi:hypothetical protein
MKIAITMDLDDDYADPVHPMGVTEAGHDAIMDALGVFGGDISIERAGDG